MTVSFLAIGLYTARVYNQVYTETKQFVESVDYSVLDDFKFYGERIKMYGANGELIKVFYENQDTKYMDIEQLRKDYLNLIVLSEDKRFYGHKGIDIRGILRALTVNIQEGAMSQGASTITQQLIRSQVLTTDKTVERKLTEMLLALKLETQRSKSEILEMYLNTVYFGYGNYGIESASQFYYGKTFNDLTLSQLCSLIPIVQSPNNFNPVADIELNNKKRETVLTSLWSQGYLLDEDYETAMADESYRDVKMSKDAYNASVQAINTTYLESAYEQAVGDLMELKNLSRKEAIQYLKDEGCSIYTYYNKDVDNMLTQIAEERRHAIDSEIQTGILLMQHDGVVSGVLEGYGKREANYTLNRAQNTLRSPGSTFKPIVAYAPAFEYLGKTSTDIVEDKKRTYKVNGKEYAPNNYNFKYIGDVPIYTAVAKSINSTAVHYLNLVGVDKGFSMAESMGITTLVSSRKGYTDRGLSLALGGITDGVKVSDMATAYNTIYTGNRVLPKFYSQVVNRDGEVLLDTSKDDKYQPVEVLKPSTTAYLMDSLVEVVQRGTATGLRDCKVPIAGKTGTTNEGNDLWFVGNTPNHTISLWYGYDIPKTINTKDAHLNLFEEIVNKLADIGLEQDGNKFVLSATPEVLHSLHNRDFFQYEAPVEPEHVPEPEPEPEPESIPEPQVEQEIEEEDIWEETNDDPMEESTGLLDPVMPEGENTEDNETEEQD